MTETNGQAPAPEQAPPVIEQGRYRVFEMPDGAWLIARAVDTCERCQACGCGTQADPVPVPAMIVQLAKAQGQGILARLRRKGTELAAGRVLSAGDAAEILGGGNRGD